MCRHVSHLLTLTSGHSALCLSSSLSRSASCAAPMAGKVLNTSATKAWSLASGVRTGGWCD